MTEKPKRVPKYKTRIKVLDSGALQGLCSCGWVGNSLAQTSGIGPAMAGVQSEIQGHKHIPKVKVPKKKGIDNAKKE